MAHREQRSNREKKKPKQNKDKKNAQQPASVFSQTKPKAPVQAQPQSNKAGS